MSLSLKSALLIALAAFPASCGGGGDGDGDPGPLTPPASTTGPTVGAVPSATRETSVLLEGTKLRADSALIVSGGASVVESSTGERSFALDVPLAPNQLNRLTLTEVFDDGTLSPVLVVPVIQDSTAPRLWLDFPAPDTTIFTSKTTVAGRVSDGLSGFMGLEVTVNGEPADVASGIGTNGTFDISDIELEEGNANEVVIEATDAVGNVTRITGPITYRKPEGSVLERVDGDRQSAPIHTELAAPLRVQVTRPNGSPYGGKIVTFRAVKSDGLLASTAGGNGQVELTVATDPSGLASAFWTVGADAGCGNNRVLVTSKDVDGAAYFTATATPGDPIQINIGTGNNQLVQAGGQSAEPLSVWVSDGCNGIEGVEVAFEVLEGGALLSSDSEFLKRSVLAMTGPTGHAKVTVLADELGATSRVSATHAGNTAAPAVFVIDSREPSKSGETRFAGQVLDNSMQPLGGATCSLSVNGLEPLVTTTNGDGCFAFEALEGSGLGDLEIDGSTITTVGGDPLDTAAVRYPSLHYELILLPKAENTLPAPILLPPLLTVNDREYTGAEDVELTIDGVEGLSMTIAAGSMTLADGTQPSPEEPVIASLNQVHHDDIPMPMPDGAAPPFAWTLQPAGATFDPPVQVTYPNMSSLAPGAVAYFLTFDHATGKFEIVSSGSVTADGQSVVSDPNSGLTLAGWGCNCPPYTVASDCANCELEITAPAPGDTSPRFIDSTPAMPKEVLKARVKGLDAGTVTFDWEYKVEFKGSGNDCSTSGMWTGQSTATGSAETSWEVPFDEFRGGKVTIKVTATLPDATTCSLTLAPYEIQGKNPTCADVMAELSGQPWFMPLMAKQESQVKQFKSDGTPVLNSLNDCGGGLFQITPRSQDDLWNWKANTASAIALVTSKMSESQTFYNNQIQQWMNWNAQNPGDTVAAPPDQTIGSYTFSYQPGQGEFPFVDAMTIKCFGTGGCSPHFFVWDNTTPGQTPQWKFNLGPYLPIIGATSHPCP